MAVCEAYGYKVDRLLGRGAFGSVCRATKDNKTVAIKHIAKRFRSGYIRALAIAATAPQN